LTSSAVNFVEAPHVAGKKRLQDARCREPIDFQQVEVIRHQDIGVERERIALTHDPKPLNECLIVAFADKYFLPIITTRHYVVEQSFGVNSRMARHRFQP
jgi:hypothetical protein